MRWTGAKTVIRNNGRQWMEGNENSLLVPRAQSHWSFPHRFLFFRLPSWFCLSNTCCWLPCTRLSATRLGKFVGASVPLDTGWPRPTILSERMVQTWSDCPLTPNSFARGFDCSWNPTSVPTGVLSMDGRLVCLCCLWNLWTSKLADSTPRGRKGENEAVFSYGCTKRSGVGVGSEEFSFW